MNTITSRGWLLLHPLSRLLYKGSAGVNAECVAADATAADPKGPPRLPLLPRGVVLLAHRLPPTRQGSVASSGMRSASVCHGLQAVLDNDDPLADLLHALRRGLLGLLGLLADGLSDLLGLQGNVGDGLLDNLHGLSGRRLRLLVRGQDRALRRLLLRRRGGGRRGRGLALA